MPTTAYRLPVEAPAMSAGPKEKKGRVSKMRRGAMLLLLCVVVATAALPALTEAKPTGSGAKRTTVRELAMLRGNTAKYHNVKAAIEAGYVPAGHCLEVPELGGMGIHYMNPALASDDVIDPMQPEVLLYEPTHHGLRLVGVEYFMASALTETTPYVFGQPFDGPMAGHEPGMPEHYDLHVWIWKNNPSGVFSPFNPNVYCGH